MARPSAKPRSAPAAKGKSAARSRTVTLLEQWVEIWAEDGKTRTVLHPANEELVKQVDKLESPPDLVYRRLNFRNGVPPEYLWTMPNKQTLRQGGGGIQRMIFAHWLQVIALESAAGSEHIGPTGVGNLPRPNERGGCECPVCTRNQGLLEEFGFQV